MKKFVCAVFAVLMMFAFAGCSLFSNNAVVKLGDYTHNDPQDLTYDKRIVLKNENFATTIADDLNASAYPDTMLYNDDGSVKGMYDYDKETGLAYGWTDTSNGKYHKYSKGKEVDLGKPDQSKIVTIPGTVTLYFVVYGNEEKTVDSYAYLILSDKEAMKDVQNAAKDIFQEKFTAENETVLKAQQSADDINAVFEATAQEDGSSASKDADAYAKSLGLFYSVREDLGVNPYKPYSEHKDPTDIEFDEKIVLTGSGQAAVEEKYSDDIASLTDYVYGKDGKVVAHYAYYECTSKEAADRIGEYYSQSERVSDTVVMTSSTGKDLESEINAYIGYSVLKDDSVSEYVRMIEETFFSSVYEQTK